MRSLFHIQTFLIGSTLLISACSTTPRADYPQNANSAQEISRLEMKIQKAKARQLDLLAPREFEQSEHYLGQARAERARDTNLAETWRNLSYARGYYDLAHQRINERLPQLEDVLVTRSGALSAGARRYPEAAKRIANADEQFRKQARGLKGTRDEQFWNSLKTEYTDAEIAAVQEARLTEARNLIKEARRNGAATYAPAALKQSEAILTSAEDAIARSPRREDGYKKEVASANESARWLIGVNATARHITKENPEKVARAVVERNRRLKEMKVELQGTATEAEINRRALAATAKDLDELKQDLANEKEINQAVADIRTKLGEDEADVFRDGDRLLIQLKKIGFKPGSAEVPDGSRPLLTKVKAAIEELHPREVVVEGHADATGSRQVNEKISAKRAEAVADYFHDVSKDVEHKGLADARPIRSNKTPGGRAANRRVDIIVVPSAAK